MQYEQESQAPPDQLTVLVVDDHLEVRMVLDRWLSNAGYRVLSAPDALAALAICAECVIDVAICDVRMETHDGVWLARQLGTRFPSIQLIFATAVENLDPRDTLGPGIVGYLVKPFAQADILEMVARACPDTIQVRRNRQVPTQPAANLGGPSGDRSLPSGTLLRLPPARDANKSTEEQ